MSVQEWICAAPSLEMSRGCWTSQILSIWVHLTKMCSGVGNNILRTPEYGRQDVCNCVQCIECIHNSVEVQGDGTENQIACMNCWRHYFTSIIIYSMHPFMHDVELLCGLTELLCNGCEKIVEDSEDGWCELHWWPESQARSSTFWIVLTSVGSLSW